MMRTGNQVIKQLNAIMTPPPPPLRVIPLLLVGTILLPCALFQQYKDEKYGKKRPRYVRLLLLE